MLQNVIYGKFVYGRFVFFQDRTDVSNYLLDRGLCFGHFCFPGKINVISTSP